MKYSVIAIVAGAALLGGCAQSQSMGEGSATPPPPSTPTCSNEGLDMFVGQKANAELGARMLEVSGARNLRWVPPRSAVTMDFRQDRLTVSYDDDMMVTRLSCG